MLEDIQKNIARLISLYETEKKAKESALSELRRAQATIESDRQQIAELKEQIENLKLAGAFLSSSRSSVEAKDKINALIREIDRCINLLEN